MREEMKTIIQQYSFFPCVFFQLPGIAKMFSNEMTLASAWLHLLAVDLFAARSLSLSTSVSLSIYIQICMYVHTLVHF